MYIKRTEQQKINTVETVTTIDNKMMSADFKRIFELGLPPVDGERIEQATTEILTAAGEDPNRDGLLNTPHRVAKMYTELLSGYRTDPIKLINNAIFDVEYDDMVIVKDIEFSSLCEHHMLPFIGHAHIAYIPHGKVIGLSKIPRIVDMFASRLTNHLVSFLFPDLRYRRSSVRAPDAP